MDDNMGQRSHLDMYCIVYIERYNNKLKQKKNVCGGHRIKHKTLISVGW